MTLPYVEATTPGQIDINVLASVDHINDLNDRVSLLESQVEALNTEIADALSRISLLEGN
jgi:tetrahydromethanopterin S-methyltransferase subunit G